MKASKNKSEAPQSSPQKAVTNADIVDKLLSETLPQSFDHLEQRHREFQDAAGYLEEKYVYLQRQGHSDLSLPVQEAKELLTGGLLGLAQDFKAVSLHLQQLLVLQEGQVEALGVGAGRLGGRLRMARSQQERGAYQQQLGESLRHVLPLGLEASREVRGEGEEEAGEGGEGERELH